jgi:hypothetical protein
MELEKVKVLPAYDMGQLHAHAAQALASCKPSGFTVQVTARWGLLLSVHCAHTHVLTSLTVGPGCQPSSSPN